MSESVKQTLDAVPQEPSKRKREWASIREECVSGGELSDECDLVAAAKGLRHPNVVLQKLECGCILVPTDTEDDFLV